MKNSLDLLLEAFESMTEKEIREATKGEDERPRDLKMYILVNKDVKIGKGKLAGQVGHAVNVYIYNIMKNGSEIEKHLLDKYMSGEIKKIIVYDTQENLEEFEKDGYISIRDKGYTELDPNTLTCVNYGIVYENDAWATYPSTLKLV